MKFPVLVAALLVAPFTAGSQEEKDEGTRIFALPMLRDTRELSLVAEEHLRDERYPEALAVLQSILEDHGKEVLPPRPDALSTYPGAAEWALERLFALPEPVRAEYAARYGPRADRALALAKQAPERAAFMEIARQWPLVPAAIHAWWALGDLELEAGQLETAELSWRRAIDLAQRLELTLAPPPSAGRLEWLEKRASESAARRQPAVTIPRGDAMPWSTPLDMTPFVVRGPNRNLQPMGAGDKILVGTTLRLYALDAFTGEIRWQAGPPNGWGRLAAPSASTQLFDGINSDQLYLRPAVGDGIALTVMQQPFTENENEAWQGIPIMVAIPERRLHAFDLETGRELWNHAPNLSFDGLRHRWDGTGTYAQRMMVAGTPTVAGARILVPCYRMQGRIDYHVACYELHTGELLWSTLVISGQRERNMFGRSVSEFCASPLVVDGDRVVAQTELGTLAALDLFTGDIRWQKTYRQLALPKTRNYQAPRRTLVWSRLAPPAVVGDVIVAAPSDSPEIMALRASDGAEIWAYSEEALQGMDRRTDLLGFDLFLGADQDTIYLSGVKLAALQKPGGLSSSANFVPRWTKRLERPDSSPRALLTPEVLLAPSAVSRTAFDRRTGEIVPALTGDWNRGEAGGLWLDEGALFSLSTQGISGYFDWQAQLEKARRLAGSAADDDEIRAAAELFLRRGKLLLKEGELEESRSALEEGRFLLTRVKDRSQRHSPVELEGARTLAEVLALSQRREEALQVLREARELVVSRDELANLLFQEHNLLQGEGGPARIRVLDEIETCWGDTRLPEDIEVEAARSWIADAGGERGLEPIPDPLPTSLWTAMERASEYERAGHQGLALEDLHRALEAATGLSLARGYTVPFVVRERIARILRLPAGREAYGPMEALAQARLEEARSTGQRDALEELCEAYPHSQAAAEALDMQIQRALEVHEPRAVAELIGRALTRGGLEAERETELMLLLARALGRQGNADFECGLVETLAKNAGGQVSPLPEHRGATLADLAEELAKNRTQPSPALVRFDSGLASVGKQRPGSTVFLGAMGPLGQAQESAPVELHLYATRQRVRAYSSSAPGDPLWEHALSRPLMAGEASSAMAPGRFLYTAQDGIVCLDERGETRWTLPTPGDPPRWLGESNGVLVALTPAGTVLACDSLYGLPLWEKALGTSGHWRGPVLGGGHAAFFSQVASLPPRALVLDLYRGRVTADIRLGGFDARSSLEDSAWIAEGRLIAPSFQVRPSRLAAFDLSGGQRAWTIEFGREESFHALAHFEDKTYPITLSASLGTLGNGGVYELDVRTGTVRRVVPLKPGERLMGIEEGAAVRLDAPYLFTFTHSETERSVPIRAIHLPYGILWTWSLPIAPQEIYDGGSLPMPAVSADTVAIAYPLRRSGGTQGEVTVVLVDKRAGKKAGTVSLAGAFAYASRVEMHGLGETLFVLGWGSSPRGACLEILENFR